MKVLFTWHAAVEPAYRKFFDELARLGVEVKLIVPSAWTEGSRLQRFTKNPAEVCSPQAFSTVFTDRIRAFFYPDLPGLVRELRAFSPDIIHIMEEPFSLCASEFILAAKLSRSKAKNVLFSFENIEVPQNFPYSGLQKFNLKNSDALVVVPEESAALWRRRGFRGKIAKIHLGIDTCIYKRVSENDAVGRFHGEGRFAIGYVGRIVEEKGLGTVIESMALLKRKGIDALFYLMGDGPYAEGLKAFANGMGLHGSVRFIGAKPQKELPVFYRFVDAVVLPSKTTPSWKEQFGRVLPEAMACGTPVVGSSSGEIPHVIGDAGLVFREGDPEGLSSCLERLAKEPGLRELLSDKGAKRVDENFSWQAVARSYAGFYQELLSDN